MCEQTEINYLDGEVVWVKLGSCWWPGEVVATDKLPPDVLPSFRKPPIAVVKFFEEDAYEYVKNINSIYKYNCSRKNEFINKGLYMYRTKHGHMEKFPEDVIRAETAVGGDIEILTRDEFQETKKESYAGLFGDPAKRTPASNKKGKGRGRLAQESPQTFHPVRKMKEKTDYKVHILVQGSKAPSTSAAEEMKNCEPPVTPSTSATEPSSIEDKDDKPEVTLQNDNNKPISSAPPSTPTPSTPSSGSGIYACHSCPFTTCRLNVLIMHNKTHSVTFVPYTPSPVRKKPVSKFTPKSTPNSSKTPKPRKPRAEKTEKPKKAAAKKRSSEEKATGVEVKKPKTDEEIKSSLLADWDDVDEDSNDGSNIASSRSPEVGVGAESPAVPTAAELPTAQIPDDIPLIPKKKVDSSPSSEKPESSSDSKYEFCEDEDWPVEAGVGRKIPRVKNPKRTDETKSSSLDDDEMAREVAELLNKTSVPELPSVPEPLKVEENFPEPSIVKSPDKRRDPTPEKIVDKPPEQQPTKAIFKTKTFFRSRHSRSQDAIGKYVAEQLNAVERMDIAERDINGSEVASSPDARESPPIEPVKVTRLAPKIQLKKMKLEAAQQREKEKNNYDQPNDLYNIGYIPDVAVSDSSSIPESPLDVVKHKESDEISQKSAGDATYSNKEIKSIVTVDETNTISKETVENDNRIEQSANINNSLTEPETPTVTVEENETNSEISINSENKIDEVPVINFPEPVLPNKSTTNSYLNETTASAVDALLSVSREADRVTKNISNDLPENLFEDDNTTGEQEEELTMNTTIESHENNIGSGSEEKELSLPVIPDVVDTNNSNSLHSEITFGDSQTSDNVVMKDVQINSENSSQPSQEEELPADNVPSESDLQIAETLISLPSTAVQSKMPCETIHKALTPMLFESEESSQEGTITLNPQDEIEYSNSQDSRDELTFISNHEEVEISSQDDMTTNNQADVMSINNQIIPDSDQEEVIATSSEEEVIASSTQEEVIATSTQEEVIATSTQEEAIATSPQEELIATSPQEEVISTNSQEDIVPMNECVEDTVIDEKEQLVESKIFDEPQFVTNNDSIKNRFETEQENLNAAQSLVQMSEYVDHTVNIVDGVESEEVIDSNAFNIKSNNGIDNKSNTVKQILDNVINEKSSEVEVKKTKIFDTPSKLLKILENPCKPRTIHSKANTTKSIIMQGKEKILNFDVAKSSFKSKPQPQSPKQKIIIRRTAPANKNVINNVGDRTSQDKIILSRSGNLTQDGASVQTYTIQTTPDPPSDANTIIIQQKIRKIAKPPPKLQKVKPQQTLVAPVTEIIKPVSETVTTDDAMFDINSMPIVLSDDLLTPESIEKMPVVMSDANIISHTLNPTKIVKPKPTIIENEKISVTSSAPKPELKKLLLNPITEVSKSSSPNILSKSSKLRGSKPMLVIDKTTGKQKIIMTKSEPLIKEVKQAPTIIQTPQLVPASKSEKFIILPTNQNQPRSNRTQKIVIDPQTGKAHVIVSKGNDPPITAAENKPVSAKLVPSDSDASASGNTVMIITNAQGTQSRIVLTPEHEKILFPNKQQPNVSQLKTIAHRITTNSPTPKKIITTMASVRPTSNIAPARPPARIVPKQKSAIITSKGQLIVGGRVATTAQNIAPMPEIRPVPKPRVTNEPKKIIQTVQKTNTEPIIYLQQKSGAVLQLTAAQFEHLQRTGQIVQRTTVPVQEKVVIQKNRIISEPGTNAKTRIRKTASEAPTPSKKMKPQEIPIAPAPPPVPAPAPAAPTLMPALTSVIHAPPAPTPAPAPALAGTSFSELDNFEELLPSTAIARQASPPAPPPLAPLAPAEPAPASLADGQLLAVPGEHFGGPVGTFYLCVEDGGTFTPIDNRPLVLENNQLVPMEAAPAPQPERRDILEAALANSDVFHADSRDDAPDFRDLNANVSVHCRVSETSTTLHQPIMTPVEVPSKADSEPAVPSSLEDGLAVIGVTPHCVPTSLELPITVTDPRIAPKTTDPLSGGGAGCAYSGGVQEPVMSMPLLAEEESGKSMPSMPILTDEVGGASSVESGSPASLEDAPHWTRRLLTPCSDMSDASAEIPLQPALHLTVDDLSSQT